MAYRTPRFGTIHAARGEGAVVSVSPDAADFYPETALYDNRGSSPFRFGSAVAGAKIAVDRGTGPTASEPLAVCVIPPGHNLNQGSGSVLWEHSDDGVVWEPAPVGIVSDVTTTDPTKAIAIYGIAGATSDKRHQRLRFLDAFAWQLSEVVFSDLREPARGPAPNWTRGARAIERVSALEGGGSGVWRTGPPLDRHRIRWEAQDDTSLEAHWALLEAIGYGRGTPFVLEPPDARDAALWVALAEPPRPPAQDFEAPAVGPGPTYTFEYIVEEVR